MSYFRPQRDVELSTIDYITTQVNANWTGVTTVKTFTQVSEKALPVICVRLLDNNAYRKEIGTTTLENRYGIIIDIFAKSDGQRLDLADFITEQLKDGWTSYNFWQTSGSPESLSKLENGRIQLVKFTRNSRIDFGENVDVRDRFRHVITCIVRKS